MRFRLRGIIALTLGSALWLVADGVKCLWTGSYFGRTVSAMSDAQSAYAYVDEAGRVVSYGAWADYVTHLGLDVHQFAPLFIGVAALGLLALFLFLQARVLGWAALLTYALIVSLRIWSLSFFGAGLILLLLWPGTLRAVIDASRPSPGSA